MKQEGKKKYGEDYIRRLPARIQQLYRESLNEMPPFERLWHVPEEPGMMAILRFEKGQRKVVRLLRRGSLDLRWVGMSLDKRYVALTAVTYGQRATGESSGSTLRVYGTDGVSKWEGL